MSSGVTFVFWAELECGRDKVYSTATDKVMDEALVSIHSASNLYRYIKDILWYRTVKALYFHFEWASVAWKYILAFISLSATTRTVCLSWRDSLQRMIALMSGNLSDYFRDYCLFSIVAAAPWCWAKDEWKLYWQQFTNDNREAGEYPVFLVVNVTFHNTSFQNS